MLFESLGLLAACALGASAAAEPPVASTLPDRRIRVERMDVRGGGELITYFKRVSNPFALRSTDVEVPFVSVLRDTLGDKDPENDRLRDIWSFTYTRPSVFKSIAAAVPFLYRRTGWWKSSGTPQSLIDMGAPAKGTAQRLLGNILQSTVVDPLGVPYRLTTRVYRSRSSEYRAMNLWRTIDVLSAEQPASGGLTSAELDSVKGRLLLSRGVFGGLVDDQYVVPAWNRFESNAAQARGRNWDLLRQRAEENRLYFQPLKQAEGGASFALLWMNHADYGEKIRYDSRFLGIADPFTDPRVRRWKDYSEVWWLDENGAVVPAGTEGAHGAVMIPLALYSLEYPNVPLLVVDFRDPGKPRRREMVRRAADDVTTGVLGWTGFGNWTYLAVKSSWSFIHGRHGAALDRSARVRAYVRLHQALLDDDSLDPSLRRELAMRSEGLGVNPLETSFRKDPEIASRHYSALVKRVENGEMSAQLSAMRAREAEPLMHSAMSRALRRTVGILRVYRHQDPETPEQLALVDIGRRIQWHRRYLQDVLAAGPRPEVVADIESVRRSIAELNALAEQLPETRQRSARLASAVGAAGGE